MLPLLALPLDAGLLSVRHAAGAGPRFLGLGVVHRLHRLIANIFVGPYISSGCVSHRLRFLGLGVVVELDLAEVDPEARQRLPDPERMGHAELGVRASASASSL